MHAGDLQRLDVLHARVAERLRHRLRGAAHLLRRKAGGGYAGDAAEVHQRLLPVVEPRVQVAQRSSHDAVRRHAHAPITEAELRAVSVESVEERDSAR
jgi:hypothetical protein